MTFMTYDGVTDFALIEQPVVNEAIAVLQEKAAWHHGMSVYCMKSLDEACGVYDANLLPLIERSLKIDIVVEQQRAARASAAARKLAGVE